MFLTLTRLLISILDISARRLEKYVRSKEERRWWKERLELVLESADNNYIPRHPLAGTIANGIQVMHNGQKIIHESYYGKGLSCILKLNRGVHEPQEERVFAHVLESLPKSPTMVELGSYWAFYSMWFLQKRPAGKAILYEPSLENMRFGVENFKLNNLIGDFNNAFIGSEVSLDTTPQTVNLPFIFKTKHLDQVDILHSDIQGYEIGLLESGRDILASGKIGYLFVSTHSNELHEKCKMIIKETGFTLLCEANLNESYSYDGIIVARHNSYPGIDAIQISKRQSAVSSF